MAEYIEREAVLKSIEIAQEDLQTNDDKMWNINKWYFQGLAWANRIVRDASSADVVKVSELTPCDACAYNPPSSGDGKPCAMCPARVKRD